LCQTKTKILKNYLSEEELNDFKTGNTGIFSITVFAEKSKSAVIRIVAIKRYRKAISHNNFFNCLAAHRRLDVKFCIINI